MSLMKRVARLFQKAPAPAPTKSVLELGPGDVCEVSLITYQVTGSTRNRSRNAVVLTLQDGADIRYLRIEEREKTVFELYRTVDGRLDNLEEIPSTLEWDGTDYFLEEQFSGAVTVTGKTPFTQSGEQYVWEFQSNDRRLLRVEWQDGRFMLYEGETVLPADVQVLHGK